MIVYEIWVTQQQHAWSLTTSTRSLLTDPPGPYFQPILHERRQTPEGMAGNMDMPLGPHHAGILPGSLQGSQGPKRQANSEIITSLPQNVPEYIQRGIDQDALSTYTSLDDYDIFDRILMIIFAYYIFSLGPIF